MKQVKNKMTGDIGELDFDSKEGVFIVVRYDLLTKVTSKSYYKNLKDLNEEWEDYEEPKEYWHIFGTNITKTKEGLDKVYDKKNKQIGNYFETKEEAELALRKLKAWKRLKDKGFRFTGWTIDDGLRISICSNIDEEDIYDEDKRKIKPDLDLLFCTEEDD